jgi:hypothetical protein
VLVFLDVDRFVIAPGARVAVYVAATSSFHGLGFLKIRRSK